MKPAITYREFQLREWQNYAYNMVYQAIREKKKSFLTVATPGAGKTKFALTIAHGLLLERIVERVVIVAPTEHLKTQWAIEAHHYAGIQLDPNFKNQYRRENSDYHGIVITYALLGMDKELIHAQNTFNKKTLVVFDECHHGGESKTWGDAMLTGFTDAVFVLNLSGTPFRSDDSRIPFVTYENGISKADYTYSYGDALRDGVVRGINFITVEGEFEYEVGGIRFKHTFSDYIQSDLKSKRLLAAIEAEGGFAYYLLKQAHIKLLEVRKTHPTAGGLIAARDQDHAQRLVKVMQKISGRTPVIAISDDPQSKEKIASFRDSSDMWIVTVKMVSEGVDIPRIRILSYLTNVKKELFFIQIIGRTVRVIPSLPADQQESYIYIPRDRDFNKMITEITDEKNHALAGLQSQEPLPDLFGNKPEPYQGDFQIIQTQATGTQEIHVNLNIRGNLKRTYIRVTPEEELPIYEQEKRLRDRINNLAKQYAKTIPGVGGKLDFRAAHRLWIKQGGQNIELEDLATLRRREEFYNQLLQQRAS